MRSLNPLKDIQEKTKQLIKEAEDNPESVHSELQTMLKPAIKIGNKFGDPEPEKELYRDLKEMNPSDSDMLIKSLKKWRDSRDGND